MPADNPLPFVSEQDGLRLTVRVTPRAKNSAIIGVVRVDDNRTALAVRLAAPPADGAANRLLCAFLADRLDVVRGGVTIRSGAGSRIKQLHLAGDGAAIAARLNELIRKAV